MKIDLGEFKKNIIEYLKNQESKEKKKNGGKSSKDNKSK